MRFALFAACFAASVASSAGADSWRSGRDVDPFTDEVLTYLVQPPAKATGCRGVELAELVVRCKGGSSGVMILHSCSSQPDSGDSNMLSVLVREGTDAPFTSMFETSSDQSAFGRFGGQWSGSRGVATSFILRLLKNDRIAFRFDTVEAEGVTLVFDLGGLAEAMASTENDCDWERLLKVSKGRGKAHD